MNLSLSFYQSLWLLIHMIGFALIATVMVGSIVGERQLRLATDWSQRMRVGMLMKNIGLISPVASLLILASGIANMVTFGFSMGQAFSGAAAWLGVKIIFFLTAVVLGTTVSMAMGKKRVGIMMSVKNGGSSENGEAALKATYGKMNLFFAVQATLLFLILVLVLFKPL